MFSGNAPPENAEINEKRSAKLCRVLHEYVVKVRLPRNSRKVSMCAQG